MTFNAENSTLRFRHIPILAEDSSHDIGDLAKSRFFLDGIDDRWDQIVTAPRSGFNGRNGGAPFAFASAGSDSTHALDLSLLDRGVDAEHLDWRGLPIGKSVDAYDDRVGSFDRLLRSICGVLNLSLNETAFDGRERSSEGVDTLDQSTRLAFNPA